MKKYLVAAILTAAFVTPALAEDFYVAADLASGKCEVMNTKPDLKKYKMMGHYTSKDAASSAMANMTDCK